MNLNPYIERRDGPFRTRTDVFPSWADGMIVQQRQVPVGTDARIFIPWEDLPAVIEMMQAVYDKHAPKKEANK